MVRGGRAQNGLICGHLDIFDSVFVPLNVEKKNSIDHTLIIIN